MLSKKTQYIYLFIIYFMSNLLLYIVNLLASHEHGYIDGLRKLSQECIFLPETPITEILTSWRGSKYYVLTLDKEKRERENHLFENEKDIVHKRRYCLMTMWAFTHMWLYLIIGFYCPKLFFASFFVGVLFEYFEGYFFQCHDALDIVFNSLGFLIGYQLQKWVFKQRDAFKTGFRPSLAFFTLTTLLIAYGFFYKIKNYQTDTNKSCAQ